MACDDSSLSPEFGDTYKPRVLSYSDLDEDCHYLILREADPVKFKKPSARKGIERLSASKKTKSRLKTLKDLEKEKRRISDEIRALTSTPQPVEVIDLVSDDENTTQKLTALVEATKIQTPKPHSSNEQSKVRRQSNETSDKNPAKRYAASDSSEKESVISDEPCKRCRKRKLKKRRGRKYAIDSSDSVTSKNKRKRTEKEKLKEIAKRNPCGSKNYERYSNDLCDESLKKFHDVEEIFGEYRCRVCNIEVHSEVTLQTHLVGRKHLKMLKAQAIPQIALQSLEQFSSKPSSLISDEGNQPIHYPPPSPGMTRIRVKKIAKLQSVAESYRRQPITGLTYVIEIHLPGEVIYYCELCDANCAAISIMCHLVGFKHKLNFFKMKYPIMYERFQYKHKRDIENEMMKLLFDYDRTHGRGLIKVEEEVPNLQTRKRHTFRRRSYSPHKENCECRSREAEIIDPVDKRRNVPDSLVTDDLDVSMNDFYCKVCDSHMNNEQMWEAHVRGRRHLKNKKKRPGENPSKVKNIHCPGEKPALMDDLLDIREPVVGLNYIQEIQGRVGNQYKCFLCGAGCTSFDIIEHILSEKHRMKLLETENKKGKKNDIETILNLSLGLSVSSREKLVAQEAAKFQKEYGKGRMLVYKSKDIFPDCY